MNPGTSINHTTLVFTIKTITNMFGQLEATEEYNNSGALLGLDGDNDELVGELLGALKR